MENFKTEKLLQQYFGYSSYRTGQKQVIEHVLSGHNTLCMMPTGGGKSICYQISALILKGTTLVVSPLISLMKDQVDELMQIGISATYINSSLSHSEIIDRLEQVRKGVFKLLYIAPERLEDPVFIESLQQMTIPLIAVDEAHCISQWGHDFRPSYRYIQNVIAELQNDPVILALTATATTQVRQDICALLNIPTMNTLMTSFARPNLVFKILKNEDSDQFLVDYIHKNQNEVGIIYAATRKNVEQIYNQLKKADFAVAKYHAGLDHDERKKNQEAFSHDRVNVIVATSAFGMGIDKSNVRYVIHYQMPKNMESYYQEAGRAGRDGLMSECILFYRPQDVQVQRYLIDQSVHQDRLANELENLQAMIDYCHIEGCLQTSILNYFGEVTAELCGQCENCTDTRERIDVTTDAQKVLLCVTRLNQRFGKIMIARVLTGSKNKKLIDLGFQKLQTYGTLSHQTLKETNLFIEFLISENYLAVEQSEYPTVKITQKGNQVLLGNVQVFRKQQAQHTQIVAEHPLFEDLRMWRRKVAGVEGLPPFVIFSDQTLRDICMKMPKTLDELLNVKGIGEQKKTRYGIGLLKIIGKYCNEAVAPTIEVLKKSSHLVTLELYQDGKNVSEIAAIRALSLNSIEDHLIYCAQEGLVSLKQHIPDQFKEKLEAVVQNYYEEGVTYMREHLPTDISDFMIKAFLSENPILGKSSGELE